MAKLNNIKLGESEWKMDLETAGKKWICHQPFGICTLGPTHTSAIGAVTLRRRRLPGLVHNCVASTNLEMTPQDLFTELDGVISRELLVNDVADHCWMMIR